jgi:hypothetical protein
MRQKNFTAISTWLCIGIELVLKKVLLAAFLESQCRGVSLVLKNYEDLVSSAGFKVKNGTKSEHNMRE